MLLVAVKNQEPLGVASDENTKSQQLHTAGAKWLLRRRSPPVGQREQMGALGAPARLGAFPLGGSCHPLCVAGHVGQLSGCHHTHTKLKWWLKTQMASFGPFAWRSRAVGRSVEKDVSGRLPRVGWAQVPSTVFIQGSLQLGGDAFQQRELKGQPGLS